MDRFSDPGITLPAPIDKDHTHAFHLFTLLVDQSRYGISRNEFLTGMTGQNIGIGVHYMSVPEHPYYQSAFGWEPEDYPNAMWIDWQTVSLPLSPALSDQDISNVIEAVKSLL